MAGTIRPVVPTVPNVDNGDLATEPEAAATDLRVGAEPEVDAEPESEVEVCVLGSVDVRGTAGPFGRAGAFELVIYLAMHPQGATTERWATALWPDRLPAASSLHSTVSSARRALGRSAAGAEHLPRGRGPLRLGQTVGSDQARLAAAAATDDPRRWRAGLSAVRGRPFEDLGASDWTVLEGHAAAVEELVVGVAARLARDRLDHGDGAGAEWAARRGLLASPYDERLYRLLLVAADQQGNPGGMESVMATLVGLVSGTPATAGPPGRLLATPGALACVHPRTAALYQALSADRAAAGRVVARL